MIRYNKTEKFVRLGAYGMGPYAMKRNQDMSEMRSDNKKNVTCGTCRRADATVIFASGEFYCFAVVFGYRRVIFAMRA